MPIKRVNDVEMKLPKKYLLILLGLMVLIGFWVGNSKVKSEQEIKSSQGNVIRYVSIGDSYTIGNGVKSEERWPNLLTDHLNEQGLHVELIANPSVSGYTVRDAINLELPIVEQAKPDFVTVLIGANDNFGGEDVVGGYESDLKELLDGIQGSLTKKDNLLLIAIPDYSRSPAGRSYGAGEDISRGIAEYNDVIKKEAKERGLKVVDIFPLSQTLTTDDYFISDGLHPSAKGYQEWEKIIMIEAIKLLRP